MGTGQLSAGYGHRRSCTTVTFNSDALIEAEEVEKGGGAVQPSQSCGKSPNMTVNCEATENGGQIFKVSEQIYKCFEIN